MRKYLTLLVLVAMFVGLSGCGSSHHHKASESSMFNDDTRVKN